MSGRSNLEPLAIRHEGTVGSIPVNQLDVGVQRRNIRLASINSLFALGGGLLALGAAHSPASGSESTTQAQYDIPQPIQPLTAAKQPIVSLGKVTFNKFDEYDRCGFLTLPIFTRKAPVVGFSANVTVVDKSRAGFRVGVTRAGKPKLGSIYRGGLDTVLKPTDKPQSLGTQLCEKPGRSINGAGIKVVLASPSSGVKTTRYYKIAEQNNIRVKQKTFRGVKLPKDRFFKLKAVK